MYTMDAKLILNNPESSSQDEIKTIHLPEDGLRILARVIARDLLTRRSAYTKKNDVEANDTQASVDRLWKPILRQKKAI